MPVGAGTSRFQRGSLRLWEAFEAARARRPRAALFHSALKLVSEDGQTSTLELTPAFAGGQESPLLTGPVGFRGAERWRLFRYQLRCLPVARLPDEEFVVESPTTLSTDCALIPRILALAPTIPAYTWGRRVAGSDEMWTSDSVISFLLVRAGVDLSAVAPPKGGRAPGWRAGVALATGYRAAM